LTLVLSHNNKLVRPGCFKSATSAIIILAGVNALLVIRSLIFNVVFYLNLVIQMLVQTPFYFFLPHRGAMKVLKNWCRSTNWLHRKIVGTNIEIEGVENIPKGGFIIAAKHQSLWEFYAILPLFKDPAYILKRELMWIPLFGWYVAKTRMIPINRGKRGKALREMTKLAKVKIAEGRQILIYPEGTRRTPGAEPMYKYGVTHMYKELDCPVLPIALNSGLYWPRRKFMRYPGTIRVRILEPIMPGMDEETFQQELKNRIENSCMELYKKAAKDDPAPPIPTELKTQFADLSN
jgi:1-acyl-sn-glycerol-3-phosphate acyltransferase